MTTIIPTMIAIRIANWVAGRSRGCRRKVM
jgi:hypothetical protein